MVLFNLADSTGRGPRSEGPLSATDVPRLIDCVPARPAAARLAWSRSEWRDALIVLFAAVVLYALFIILRDVRMNPPGEFPPPSATLATE